ARMPGPRSAEVFVKLEGANPTGSMKDRMALSMVEGAERRGVLKPGGTVVDYTGGSTGSSLAMVCAAKGYKARFVSSDAFAEEKIQTMRAFGATVEIHKSVNRKVTPELIQAMIARARELAAQPNHFWTDQFNNPDNRAGYHPMAREILTALDGRLDAFVMAVGTGGCFSGNAEVLKERAPRRAPHRGDRARVRAVDLPAGPGRRHRRGERRGRVRHRPAAGAGGGDPG